MLWSLLEWSSEARSSSRALVETPGGPEQRVHLEHPHHVERSVQSPAPPSVAPVGAYPPVRRHRLDHRKQVDHSEGTLLPACIVQIRHTNRTILNMDIKHAYQPDHP